MNVFWLGCDATSCGEWLPVPCRRTLPGGILPSGRSEETSLRNPCFARFPTPAPLARATPLGVTVAGSHSRDVRRAGIAVRFVNGASRSTPPDSLNTSTGSAAPPTPCPACGGLSTKSPFAGS